MSLLDHIADDVLAGRRREEWWSELRNIYFPEGTPEEGWRALLDWAKAHHIEVRAEEVRISGRSGRWVTFTPRASPTS
jgi:hypothetical protein